MLVRFLPGWLKMLKLLLWLIYTECSSDSARLKEESELSALSVQLFTIPEASLGR